MSADTAPLFDRDRESLSSSVHTQPHRATETCRSNRAHDDECRVRFPRESGETHRDGSRDRRRGIEHDEREGGAPQQDVRAPRRLRRFRWAQDPETDAMSQVGPIARSQRARRVDVCSAFAAFHRHLHDLSQQRQLSRSSNDFRETSPWQSARRERVIERVYARRHPRRLRQRRGQ